MSAVAAPVVAPARPTPSFRAALTNSTRAAAVLLAVALVWRPLCWLARHRRWSLCWGLPVAGVWCLGPRDVGAALTGLALLPAVLAGVWSTRWPASYRRWLSEPWRRRCLRRWARREWPSIARSSGLSALMDDPSWLVRLVAPDAPNPRRRWVHPQLVSVLTGTGTLTLRVRPRRGQSVEEVAASAPRIRDAARAEAVRCTRSAPSVLDVVLTLDDPLVGTRLSALAAGPADAPRAMPAPLDAGGAVVVGRGADGHDVRVDLADAWHIAAQGATRSGKSALTYTLLGQLAHRADVLVCGVDPSGILLGPWLDGRGREWIATGTSDSERAVRALTGVIAEMDRRIEHLTAVGSDKLDRFDAARPLLLVVLEEYPGALSAARSQDDAEGRTGAQRTAPRIERAVGRLVKEGAKVGVRVVLLAQRMSARAIDTDDRSNFGLRITLRVDNGDAVGMLHDGPAAREYVEAARQFPAGTGLIEGPEMLLQRWRADLTDYASYRAQVLAGAAAQVPGAFTATSAIGTAFAASALGVEVGELSAPRTPRSPRSPRASRAPRPSAADKLAPVAGDAA